MKGINMLIFKIILYLIIFISLGIYDFFNFSGIFFYMFLTLDIVFCILTISLIIENYIKKEVNKKKNK